MSQWKVALLVILALAAGIGAGYLGWGATVARLAPEVRTLTEEVERLRRELDARDSGANAGLQRWEGIGVVRAIYPQLLMITHDEIPGLQPARTTGFRTANGLSAKVGDSIRFVIEGTAAHNSVIVAIETL